MLLNHIVVGILLLPLGILTLYAASDAASGVRWALVVTRVVAVSIAALAAHTLRTHGTQYFGAVPFRVATVIVCARASAPTGSILASPKSRSIRLTTRWSEH